MRCLFSTAERTWAALGLTFPGVALPNGPYYGHLSLGLWGVHDDDDLPKPEAYGIISAQLNRRSPTSSRHTVPRRPGLQRALYSIHYTLLFFTPPHVALISARLDRGISPVRSVSLASPSTASP